MHQRRKRAGAKSLPGRRRQQASSVANTSSISIRSMTPGYSMRLLSARASSCRAWRCPTSGKTVHAPLQAAIGGPLRRGSVAACRPITVRQRAGQMCRGPASGRDHDRHARQQGQHLFQGVLADQIDTSASVPGRGWCQPSAAQCLRSRRAAPPACRGACAHAAPVRRSPVATSCAKAWLEQSADASSGASDGRQDSA